ncbi:hypothetical protein [Corallococcus sp. RDP092CA]|uniref:hypothetical protein n=1 Tax=Corallococcus sp. RDP092CA TaxID=3109369 RepID=UPI0035AF2071
MIGGTTIGSLSAGQCREVPLTGSAQPPPAPVQPGAPLYLGAIADAQAGVVELREDNNTRVTSRLVLGDGPDLVVRSVTAPANLPPYSAFSAQVKVCNEGNLPLYGSAPVDLLISTEKSLYVPGQGQPPYTQVQMPVGNVMVSALAAGQCTTLPVQGSVLRPPAATPGQSLYLGALVDAQGAMPDLLRDNNARTMATPIGQAQ